MHSGTGIYGVNKRKITPKKAKVLKRPFGLYKSIKGQKANPYLINAWNIYKDGGLKRASNALAKNAGEEIVKEIRITIKNQSKNT